MASGSVVSMSIGDVTINETEGSAMLTVALSSPSSNTVQVNYKTLNGTATQPKDYKKTTGTLTFAPGSTSSSISVPINQDNIVEPNEYFDVELSGAINATIADGLGRVTIVDGTVTTTAKANDAFNTEMNYLNVRVNNPTRTQFFVNIGSSSNSPINFKITDVNGRIVEVIRNESPGKTFIIGNKYFAGTYFAEITQGQKTTVVKLIKL